MGRTATLLIVAAIVAILAVPALLGDDGGTGGEPFAGTDTQATAAIGSLAPDYRPWAAPLWVPPSASIESGLFALQAALGAGALGYCLGRRRQRQRPPAADATAVGDDSTGGRCG